MERSQDRSEVGTYRKTSPERLVNKLKMKYLSLKCELAQNRIKFCVHFVQRNFFDNRSITLPFLQAFIFYVKFSLCKVFFILLRYVNR